MGHNSQEGFFLGQELLLDFPAWLDLTSNADNMITVYQLPSKSQNTFYDASQPPGRRTRYYKRCRLQNLVFFAYVISRKRRATQQKKLQGNVFQLQAKIQLIWSKKKTTTKIVTYSSFLTSFFIWPFWGFSAFYRGSQGWTLLFRKTWAVRPFSHGNSNPLLYFSLQCKGR